MESNSGMLASDEKPLTRTYNKWKEREREMYTRELNGYGIHEHTAHALAALSRE